MSDPLLTTKLFLPSLRTDRVNRSRLVERLNKGLLPGVKLVLISAPAGFGKTTLAVEWVRSTGFPAAWLALDSADNDPIRLWHYLIAAFQTIHPEIGKTAFEALQVPQPPPLEMLVTLLINDLITVQAPFLLLLDDYHLLEVPAIHTSLNFFIDHLPPNAHLVILTRADPPLHLARRRGRGEVIEVRAADLRFDLDEIRQFLTGTMKLGLSQQDLAALETRTEGWIAGLQLAAISLQGREDPHDFVSALTGDDRYIADYLIEEVLQNQPENIQHFLLQTSILERLSAALCEAVTGVDNGGKKKHGLSGSQADAPPSALSILNYLDQSNLFIVPLDNHREWFRYHTLFAQLLRQHLIRTSAPGFVMELYRRASNWHLENGYLVQAVEYALASRDFDAAAQMIERVIEKLFLLSELNTLARWSELLPPEVLSAHPGLCLGLGWAANATNHPEMHEKLIQMVERWAGMTVEQFLALEEPVVAGMEQKKVSALIELAVQRTRIFLDQGDTRTILDRYERIWPYLFTDRGSLAYLFNSPSSLRSPFALIVALAQEMEGDILPASVGFETAVREATVDGNIFVVALALGHLGMNQITLGRLNEAEETFMRALQIARDFNQQQMPFFGMAQIGLGCLAYERNDLANAESHLDVGISLGHLWRSWEVLMPGYTAFARLRFIQKNEAAAFQALDNLAHMANSIATVVIDTGILWQAYFCMRRGQTGKAADLLRQIGLDIERDAIPANPDQALMLSRLLVELRHYEAASRILTAQLAQAETEGRWGTWIQAGVLLAQVDFLQGQKEQALDLFAKILAKAEPEGYMRSFLDEGEGPVELLHHWAGQGHVYATQILKLWSPNPEITPLTQGQLAEVNPISSPQLIESLSQRELEILRMVAAGASNADIAQKAYISLNTVKKHITNIYGKLNVTTRLQAVEKARELGFLENPKPV
jgi:LuxR family transcriptional regulator, maltose regulon positive regulatory protein